MARLEPRERLLLWLAYAHGATHHEIAKTLGLTTGTIKQLLCGARRRHGVAGVALAGVACALAGVVWNAFDMAEPELECPRPDTGQA